MKKCEWRIRLKTIVDEVNSMMKAMELIVEIVEAMADSNETKKKITSIRNRLTRCKKKVLDEVDTSRNDTLVANRVNLRWRNKRHVMRWRNIPKTRNLVIIITSWADQKGFKMR